MTKEDRMKQGIAAAFEQMRAIVDDPDAFAGSAVVVIDLAEAPEVFSAERVRLLKRLRDREEGYASVTALAKALRRDTTRVSRDLDVLEHAGLVTRTRTGKAKRIEYRRGPIMLA